MEKSGVGDGELKAIIMAAGPTYCDDEIGFPPDSKPKCLFHPILPNWNPTLYTSDPIGYAYNKDETLLERQVRLLRSNGIERIRIVTGYRSEDIEQFNEHKDLGLEFVHNPKWETDSVNGLILGVQDLDDDLLVVYGDGFVGDVDLDNILKCDMPTVGIGLFSTMFKFGKQHLPLIKRADEFRHTRRDEEGICHLRRERSKVKDPHDNTQGIKLVLTIMHIYSIAKEKGEAAYLVVHDSTDVDLFRQTAESLGRYPCK